MKNNYLIGAGAAIIIYFLFFKKKANVSDEPENGGGGGGGIGGGGIGGGGIFPIISVEVPKAAQPKKKYFFQKSDEPPVKEGAGTRSKVADAKPRDVMTDQQAQTNKSSVSTTEGTGLEIEKGVVLKDTQSSSSTTSSRAGAIGSSAGSNTASSGQGVGSGDPFSPFDGFYGCKSKYEFN